MKLLSEKLKTYHLKVTPQRLAIFNMLSQTDRHPCAEAIYRSLEASHPSMSLATVYKTLDTLKRTGLIQEINVGEDSFRYDANNMPHAHMVCMQCQEVMDAPPSVAQETLREELTGNTGFTVFHEQIYFYGLCCSCQKAETVKQASV